jgi:hypothetical protein
VVLPNVGEQIAGTVGDHPHVALRHAGDNGAPNSTVSMRTYASSRNALDWALFGYTLAPCRTGQEQYEISSCTRTG